MPSMYRLIVPRGVSKMLNPVNLPSVRSIATPNMPRVRKPRRTTRKRTTR